MSTIRVLLVDDHAVVRSGLSRFLLVNPDMELVGEAADGDEALLLAALHQPDVVIMDLMMPGKDGITATRDIHQKYPHIKIIALTSFADQNLVQGALKAGAYWIFTKKCFRGRSRQCNSGSPFRANDAFIRSCAGVGKFNCPTTAY